MLKRNALVLASLLGLTAIAALAASSVKTDIRSSHMQFERNVTVRGSTSMGPASVANNLGVDGGLTVLGNVGTGGTVSSSVASGTNAFGVLTNGGRVDFGAGASDYASSNGTTVAFAGPISATNVAGTQSGTNTGDITLASVGSSPAAAGASLTNQVLTLQPADGSNPGVVTTGAQTIGGAKTFSGGVVIGAAGTALSDSFAASAAIDFAGVTDTCEDSSGITVTGAAVNDVCAVGPPAALPHANSWVLCYVSATDTVKVRHCAHGASGDPAEATYAVRVFDP